MLSSKKPLRRFLVPAVLLLLGLSVPAGLYLRFSPYPEWEDFLARPFSPVLTDCNGGELRTLGLKKGLRRIYTPLEEYPDYLIEIFLAGEDKRFYRHLGVDAFAVIRAAWQNQRAGKTVSGASTVTMQLAGMACPEAPGMKAKIREALGALKIEARSSKDELLELWLSSLPFGGNLEGIAAAGRSLFGTEPQNLSMEQSLLLAVIPRRPRLYNPAVNPEAAVQAAWKLAQRMNLPSSRQAIASAAAEAKAQNYPWPFRAPHFVNWLASRLPPEAWQPGPPIKTSLNPEYQAILEGALKSRVEQAGSYRISNGAGIILDARSGAVLAYTGSADFFDTSRSGQIDGVRILRQPGSTLKPFLYAMALESGYTAASLLPDIPMTFGNEEVYIPRNFNQRYNGPVRLRTALASSLNIPAVYLAEKIGVAPFADKLEELGFDSIRAQRKNLGLGIALGNAEVSLLELARAYTVFPRQGSIATLKVLAEEPPREISPKAAPPLQIFKKDSTRMIQSILSDNVNRILAFGRRGLGMEGFDAMLKTGTSNQFNNIWALGATSSIVCGIWMGNFSGETVIGNPGSGLPAQTVVNVLKQLPKGQDFEPMNHFIQKEICPLSGGLAAPACPGSMTEWFKPGQIPGPCTFHSRKNGKTEVHYPPEYRHWAQMYGITFKPSRGTENLKITQPPDGAVFFKDSGSPETGQGITVDVEGRGQGRLYVDGVLKANQSLPFRKILSMHRGFHEVKASTPRESKIITIEVR